MAPAEAAPEFDVFLSYNREDHAAVARVAEKLHAAGLRPWMDLHSLTAGGDYQDEMAAGIDESRACAVFIGQTSGGLRWSRTEARRALNRYNADPRYRVFPVLLPGIPVDAPPPLDRLPPFLADVGSVVDLRRGVDHEESFATLVLAVKGLPYEAGLSAPEGADLVCPYRGLLPFEETEEAYFFGRSKDVDALFEHLRTGEVEGSGRFVAVIGQSGSGKSSLVRAGLMPAVRDGRIPGSQLWLRRVLRPKSSPLHELATALQRDPLLAEPGTVVALADLLRTRPDILDAAVRSRLHDRPAGARLVLAVDQFEEVFTLCPDEAERQAFIAALAHAALVTNGACIVVLTLRADFIGQATTYPELAELLNRHTYFIAEMDEAGLREAIEGPALKQGVRFAPGLVDTIVEDFRGQPGQLPLLQFALTALWERDARSRLLTLESYVATGGVRRAIARRADELYASLTPVQQALARRALLRLTEPGPGTDHTRRRVSLSELAARDDERPELERVLSTLVEARLLTTDRDEASNEARVEVSHEALIRGWDNLQAWIETERETLLLHGRVRAAALEWRRLGGKDDGLLFRGARLAEAREKRDALLPYLNETERAFLDASIALADRERRARDRARLRVVVLSVTVAAVALVLFSVTYFQYQVALARQLAAQAISQPDQLDTALLLSVEAVRRSGDADARRGLLTTLFKSPDLERFLHGHEEWVGSVAFAPDGQRLASGGDNGTVILWDPATGQRLGEPLVGHTGRVNAVAFSPDSRTLATAGQDGTIVLWDVMTHQPRGAPLRGHEQPVRSVAFSPDGQSLAAGSDDATVTLWDVAAGRLRFPPLRGHRQAVQSVAFNRDGRYLASGGNDGTVRLWNPATGQADGLPLASHATADTANDDVLSVAFSPVAPAILAAGTWQGTIVVWNVVERRQLREPIRVHSTQVHGIAFHPNGQTVAAGSVDKTVTFWNLATGQSVGLPLAGHASWVNSVAYSPDGRRLASGGNDGGLILWSRERDDAIVYRLTDRSTQQQTPDRPTEPIQVPDRHTVPIQELHLSHDGSTLTAVSADGSVLVWHTADGSLVSSPAADRPPVLWAQFEISSDGDTLAAITSEGTLTLSDVRTLRPRALVPVEVGAWPYALSHVDGQELLVVGICTHLTPDTCLDSEVRVWDLAAERWLDTTLPLPGQAIAYVRAGGPVVVAVTRDGTSVVVDLETGRQLGTFRVSQSDIVSAVAVSPDGRLLATGDVDGTVEIRRLREPFDLQGAPFQAGGQVTALRFTPDGARLALGVDDGRVVLWDVAGAQQVGELQASASTPLSLAFSHDARTLAVGHVTGVVVRWDVQAGVEAGVRLPAFTGAVNTVAYWPGSQRLVTGSTGAALLAWNPDRALAFRYPLPLSNVYQLEFSQDGSRLAVNSPTSAIALYDLTGGAQAEPVFVVGARTVIALSPDGSRLAAGSCHAFDLVTGWCIGGKIELFDAKTGEPAQDPILAHDSTVTRLAFSPNGDALASGAYDGSLMVWDLRASPPSGRSLVGHRDTILALAFQPGQGTVLASGSRDTDIMLWNVAAGTRIGQPLTGHANTVFDVKFSPDGSLLASASGDRTVALWDVASQIRLVSLSQHLNWVSSVSFRPDGKALASGAHDGQVIVWNVDRDEWVARACQAANRNLTSAEWSTYLGIEPYRRTCPELP